VQQPLPPQQVYQPQTGVAMPATGAGGMTAIVMFIVAMTGFGVVRWLSPTA
jgi:hypothetical protein